MSAPRLVDVVHPFSSRLSILKKGQKGSTLLIAEFMITFSSTTWDRSHYIYGASLSIPFHLVFMEHGDLVR